MAEYPDPFSLACLPISTQCPHCGSTYKSLRLCMNPMKDAPHFHSSTVCTPCTDYWHDYTRVTSEKGTKMTFDSKSGDAPAGTTCMHNVALNSHCNQCSFNSQWMNQQKMAAPTGTPRICGNCGQPLIEGETEEECRRFHRIAEKLGRVAPAGTTLDARRDFITELATKFTNQAAEHSSTIVGDDDPLTIDRCWLHGLFQEFGLELSAARASSAPPENAFTEALLHQAMRNHDYSPDGCSMCERTRALLTGRSGKSELPSPPAGQGQ